MSQVLAANGQTSKAVKLVNEVLLEAIKFGYVAYELESTLVLGEIEIESGKTAAGKMRLQKLEKDATAKGFLLVARRAARLRS